MLPVKASLSAVSSVEDHFTVKEIIGKRARRRKDEEKNKKGQKTHPLFSYPNLLQRKRWSRPLCLDLFHSCKHRRDRRLVGVEGRRRARTRKASSACTRYCTMQYVLFCDCSCIQHIYIVYFLLFGARPKSNGQLFNLWILLFSNVGINWIYIYFEYEPNFKNIQLLIS